MYRSAFGVCLYGFPKHRDAGEFADEYHRQRDDHRAFARYAALSTCVSWFAALTHTIELTDAHTASGRSSLGIAPLATTPSEPTVGGVGIDGGRSVAGLGDGCMWRRCRRRKRQLQ